MKIDYAQKQREDARLYILEALAEQVSCAQASNVLQDMTLPIKGINQNRAWVHQQLDYLANLEAISLVDGSSVKVATLTAIGKRHLDRHIVLEGVSRPPLMGV